MPSEIVQYKKNFSDKKDKNLFPHKNFTDFLSMLFIKPVKVSLAMSMFLESAAVLVYTFFTAIFVFVSDLCQAVSRRILFKLKRSINSTIYVRKFQVT